MQNYEYFLAEELASTADWRLRKAEEHPDDERNIEAAGELTTLAEGISALGGKHPLIARYDALLESAGDDMYQYCEIERETLRCIGFTASYDSAEELLTSLLVEFDRLEIPDTPPPATPATNDNN